MNKNRNAIWVIQLIILLLSYGCKPNLRPTHSNTIAVRMQSDPENLNPIFSISGLAAQIQNKIFLTPLNFDPTSLEIVPVMLTEYPQRVQIDTGRYQGAVAYSMTFRDDMFWDNETPVTASDFTFSAKAFLHPNYSSGSKRLLRNVVLDVLYESEESREFVVIIKEDMKDAPLYFASFTILPEYIFDANHLLRAIPLSTFTNPSATANHPNLAAFSDHISTQEFARNSELVVGCGPYRLGSWESGQYITLIKKAHYWADKLSQKTDLLEAYPDTIIYRIVGDETTAIAMLKDHQLDILEDLLPNQLEQLENDPAILKDFVIHSQVTTQFYFFALNNHHEFLRERAVRQALAYCIDTDALLDITMNGKGVKQTGPVHVSKPYYNKDLSPIPYDLDKAKAILTKAGWQDRDSNGVLEKVIDGVPKDLELDLLMVGENEVASTASPLLHDGAKKIGIKVNIVNIELTQFLQKLRGSDFDIMFLRLTQPPHKMDPYGSWHSDNDKPSGRNYWGFSNAPVDSLIDIIRSTEDTSIQNRCFQEFQTILYAEQPNIFLFSPMQTILVHKRWEPLFSLNRPGYFENAFKLRE